MESLFLSKSTAFASRPLLGPRPLNSKEERRGVQLFPVKSPRSVKGMLRCSMDVSLGGGGSYNYENAPKFLRMHVWDPYKRLGVTPDSSEEEIASARNFLLQQYAGHERSVESIEAAYEKILMASFKARKKSKINLKSRLKKKVEESPPWFKTLLGYFEIPAMGVILRRLFLCVHGSLEYNEFEREWTCFSGGTLIWVVHLLSQRQDAKYC